MLLSELFNFIRNHLHLKVSTEVGVSGIPRCTSDVLSIFFEIVEWCRCCSVSCVPTDVCRRSTQASIFVCTASPYYVSTVPIFFPWANTFSCILVQALRVFSWHVPSSAVWHPEWKLLISFWGSHSHAAIGQAVVCHFVDWSSVFPIHTNITGRQKSHPPPSDAR